MSAAVVVAVLFMFQFVGVESITTVMLDAYPSLRRTGRREAAIAVYCFISYLCGLSMVTRVSVQSLLACLWSPG